MTLKISVLTYTHLLLPPAFSPRQQILPLIVSETLFLSVFNTVQLRHHYNLPPYAVSVLVKPIILTQFAASFLPYLQRQGSYLILGFTWIVSFWVTALIDALMFYDHRVFGL